MKNRIIIAARACFPRFVLISESSASSCGTESTCPERREQPLSSDLPQMSDHVRNFQLHSQSGGGGQYAQPAIGVRIRIRVSWFSNSSHRPSPGYPPTYLPAWLSGSVMLGFIPMQLVAVAGRAIDAKVLIKCIISHSLLSHQNLMDPLVCYDLG